MLSSSVESKYTDEVMLLEMMEAGELLCCTGTSFLIPSLSIEQLEMFEKDMMENDDMNTSLPTAPTSPKRLKRNKWAVK